MSQTHREPTPEDARRANAELAEAAAAERVEVDALIDDLRKVARRNHFAESLHLAFMRRKDVA